MSNPLKLFIMNFVINYRLKRFARHEPLSDFIEELKKVKKVLIIIPPAKEYTEIMQKFINNIGQVFKNARVSTFTNSSLRKTELTWFGVPNEKYLKIIKDEKFDFVIDINTEQDKVCSYLCALSGAQMRLNLSNGGYDYIYNLHFRTNNIFDTGGKLDYIVSYLSSLIGKNKPN